VASTLFEWRFPAFFGIIQDANVDVWKWLWEPTSVYRWLFGVVTLIAVWFVISCLLALRDRGPIHTHPEDIRGILQDWIGHYPNGISGRAIRFQELDKSLRLAPGSTRKYIADAAAYYEYRPRHIGEETITFTGGY
jgi:hypothetical protein